MLSKFVQFILIVAVANPLCCCDIPLETASNDASTHSCCPSQPEESEKDSSGCSQAKEDCSVQEAKEHQQLTVEKQDFHKSLVFLVATLLDSSFWKVESQETINYLVDAFRVKETPLLYQVNCTYLI